MIILDVILLIIGFVPKIATIWTIGIMGIIGALLVDDETRELHTVIKTPGITTHQLQHHRAALGKPE